MSKLNFFKRIYDRYHSFSKGIRTSFKIVFSILICFLVFVECFLGITTVKKGTSSIYLTACEDFADIYAENISTLINRFHSDLSIFSKSSLNSFNTKQAIIDDLITKSPILPPDFLNVFFADETGYATEKSGVIVYIGDRPYFKEMVLNGKDSYIGGPVISKTTGIPIFHMCESAYSSSGEKLGFYAVAIPLKSIADNIKINSFVKKLNIFIVNSEGDFLLRPDSTIISEDYVYKENPEKYTDLDSFMTSMIEGFDGTYTFNSASGDSYSVISTPIENTPWSLGIAVAKNDLNQLSDTLRHQMLMIFFLFAFCIIILFFITVVIQFYNKISEIKKTTVGIKDELTGLDTLKKFEMDVDALFKTDEGQKSDYMFINIDVLGLGFVNKTYCELLGDDVLLLFSEHLSSYTNSRKGFCARDYAGHFYAMVPIEDKYEALRNVLYSLSLYKREISAQFDESKTILPISIKNGIKFTGFHFGYDSFDELIEKTSYARQAIANKYSEDFKVFDEELNKKIVSEKQIEICLRSAFKNNEFYVVYQPKVSLSTKKIIGAEALIRWQNELLGNVPPDNFLPILEKNGSVIDLDFFVYETVFKELNDRYNNKLPVVPVSVNMSRSHLEREDFVKRFVNLFNQYSFPTDLIEIEILEQAVSTQTDKLGSVIEELHNYGFRVAMDDFGTGESSLNMLDTIPIDTLKIDRNFLCDITDWNKTQRIIKKIVELTHELNKIVVCEGVETHAQIEFLDSINCDVVQGFFYSKPLKTKDFIKYIEQHS